MLPVVNNQKDGMHRMTIPVDETSYHPNTISDNYPLQSSKEEGGFTSHRERIEAHKVRARSQSFLDHYSQAILFYHSQTDVEKTHIADIFSFELGKVKRIGSPDMFTMMLSDPRYKEFVRDTYFHFKPLSGNGAAVKFILDVMDEDLTTESGIVKDGNPADFVKAIEEGRYWDR